MPHELPGWAIYVVIALAVFCFSFLVAWRIERKALSLTVEEYNNMCSYLNDTQASSRMLTEQNEELAKRINDAKIDELSKAAKETASVLELYFDTRKPISLSNAATYVRRLGAELDDLRGEVCDWRSNWGTVHDHIVETSKTNAAFNSLTEQNEELAKRINRVKTFVRDRQVSCQNKKTGRFAPINDAELEKVMNGEEIA